MGGISMVTGLSRIALVLFFFVTMAAPYAWAEGRDVTIAYSNDINGQIYPAG
jgi:hypothetical protein